MLANACRSQTERGMAGKCEDTRRIFNRSWVMEDKDQNKLFAIGISIGTDDTCESEFMLSLEVTYAVKLFGVLQPAPDVESQTTVPTI